MKRMIVVCLIALLSACSVPSFVGDAPPVSVTSKTPERFELPARFAVARIVYGKTQTAGSEETALWNEVADRSKNLGTFAPLIVRDANRWHADSSNLIETARAQRFNYLLVVRMYPATGSADVALFDVASGGVMATVQAVSPSGGQRGFWGGQIKNPARLERATLRIAQATAPAVQDMLNGVAKRQR